MSELTELASLVANLPASASAQQAAE